MKIMLHWYVQVVNVLHPVGIRTFLHTSEFGELRRKFTQADSRNLQQKQI
jgi:hypothetical protein